jgi:uncharacterized protein (DUF362 family)
MSRKLPGSSHTRRKILYLTGLAVGAAMIPPVFRTLKNSLYDLPGLPFMGTRPPEHEMLKVIARSIPTEVSKVVLVHSKDRVSGTRRALDLLQPNGIKGKNVFLKPNYNTADPAPAATDTAMLEVLIQELKNAGSGPITVGDRSGMAETRQAMQQKEVFKLADRYGLKVLVLDELNAEQWQYFSREGTHWRRGFAFARPILDAEAIITTCCLKTHGGARYTLSLKNSVGMVAKRIPGDRFNYMDDLHTSPHMQLMIAEINAAYQPTLVLLDGVESFVNGGPAEGQKVPSNVILAGTDRVAVDVVGLSILRSLGTTPEVSQGSIWNLQQIQRAVELGLGASSAEQIELITADRESRRMADKIRPFMTA